jgi:hypothetical protein
MKTILIFVSSCIITSAYAQPSSSTSYRVQRAGVVSLAETDNDYAPILQRIEQPKPANDLQYDQIKDSLAQIYRSATRQHKSASVARSGSASVVAAPTMGINLQGNPFGGSTPNDNEIAIGNNGELISVQNVSIFRRNMVTGTQYPLRSLAAFSLPIGVLGSKYDPKVLYDPETNRFILVFLAGYTSGQTTIVVAFSQSDSSNGLWNLYTLPGNPVGDSTWSDYPMISVNHNDLFVTVNRVYDNQPWQTGFAETLIWQVGKTEGYAGDTLVSSLRRNVTFGGRPVRNMCPVEGGTFPQQANEQYFLSNRNLSAANDTIFLVHLTGTAYDSNVNITVTPILADRQYYAPPNAAQPTTTGVLATNDARVLGAFMQNGFIQYVHNTLDTTTGNAAVMHGVISNYTSTPVISSTILSDTLLEFGYPNIAYTGYNATDNSAIIIFLQTAATINPGVVAVTTDGNGGYSARLMVKQGSSFINVLSGDERWGDYSGIQRKYDAMGTVWVNGMFGQTGNSHATWIAELGVSPDVSVQTIAEENATLVVFPNPFTERITTTFTVEKAERMRFELYDANARLVQLFMEDQVKVGINQFSFSLQPLAAGVYIFRIVSASGVVAEQKVVKE